jgi:hypothetical protein
MNLSIASSESDIGSHYDPDAVVYRSRRTRIRDFITQFLRYGRGRAEQIQVEGFSWKALLFLAL